MSAVSQLSVPAFLAVGLGAAAGAWARWLLAVWLNEVHLHVPIGTWVANVLGGLLVGAALVWFSRHPELDPLWRLALVTGFLGALTTFSTFSAESLLLLARAEHGWAFAHSVLHLVGALAAAWIGFRLTTLWLDA